MSAPFALTDEERVSPLWGRLLRHFDARIAALRLLNDSPAADERTTAMYRGQITAYKALLALNTDRADLTQ
jgi:hypothetical protein